MNYKSATNASLNVAIKNDLFGSEWRNESSLRDANFVSWKWLGGLIEEHEIGLISPTQSGTDTWIAEKFYPEGYGAVVQHAEGSPIRAVAMCYLKIKEKTKC